MQPRDTDRRLRATASMRHAHAANPRLKALRNAPVPSARPEVRPAIVDGDVRREVDQTLDVLERYGRDLTGQRLQALETYVDVRAEELRTTLATNAYAPKVDGGWRSHGSVDDLPEGFAERQLWLGSAHRALSLDARAAADALFDAVAHPRRPCPFEQFIGPRFARLPPEAKRGAVVALLDDLADQVLAIPPRGHL